MAVKKVKVLEESDYLKKEYSKLCELNQKLKATCEVYYIGYNGCILMKSLVPFIEKVVFLNDSDYIPRFRGMMILPNKFQAFKADAKKTKLVITNTIDNMYLGQDDNPAVKITLNRVILDTPENIEHEKELTKLKIAPEMYSRYFEILSGVDISQLMFDQFSENDIETLCTPKPITYRRGDLSFVMTKQLFLDLKLEDSISISHIPDREDSPGKGYLFFRHTTDVYTDYTLVAYLKPSISD